MRKIVAGNWKMNLNHKEALSLLDQILNSRVIPADVDIILAPPSIYLAEFSGRISGDSHVKLAAQNVFYQASGAFTGEISATMLSSIQVEYCLVGHSERRMYFHENNDDINKKCRILLENGITPILCLGEHLEERYKNKHKEIVEQQLEQALAGINPSDVSRIIVAYEPVWAIGTGQTASTEQAQEMHAHIRKVLSSNYGEELADNMAILYGGSCNAKNAAELFEQADVNGGLVGGASLKADDFLQIAQSFQ